MSDLIKRNDALEAIKIAELGQEYDEVENVPSVDAVPVRHGYWGDEWFDHKLKLVCSACGCFADKMTEYCPNCGARMDGKEQL